ncbi:MAG: proteasome subunit beta, partial [Actinobacteria bacterium]|nr:proteasome subunit beta [Actinomycetota bacterium]
MPFFSPQQDPGANFVELVKRAGLSTFPETWSESLGVPHATTCVALKFNSGVVVAGDRRAT